MTLATIPMPPVAASEREQLTRQIAAAEQAQAALDAQKQVEAQAATAAALRQRLAQVEWAASQSATLDAQETAIKQQLAELGPKMQQWQQEFLTAYAKLETLIPALRMLQYELKQCALQTQALAETKTKVAQVNGERGGHWTELWVAFGGTSDELSPLPLDVELAKRRLLEWVPFIEQFMLPTFRVWSPKSFTQFGR